MNLPATLDIIIGLIFIYLTLSLIASEIQELIATLLQWRAEHLKKSIENLIAGGSDSTNDAAQFALVAQLANLIYDNPLIADINQEAKGPISELFRQLTRAIGNLYRRLTRTRNIFGDKSTGPSYIPAETFATSLLETVNINNIVHYISETRLERFKDQQLAEVKYIVDHLNIADASKPLFDKEFEWLCQEFNGIVTDFRNNLIGLNSSLDRMVNKLNIYIQDCQVYLPETESSGRDFQRQMGVLKDSLESEPDRKALLSQLSPSLSNVLNSIRKTKKAEETVQEIIEAKDDSPIYKGIKETINSIPEPLKDSLFILAKRAERKAENTEQELLKFQQELEVWFDRSMERASGVYKRNARGISLVIGIFIAIATNSDTLFIVGSLSTDSLMRATINRYADEVVVHNSLPNRDNFPVIQSQVNQAFEKLSLPIGWSSHNLASQEKDGQEWPLFTKRVFGWMLSGLAISMGAAFWFDLLSKILDIRNVGSKPASPSANRSA